MHMLAASGRREAAIAQYFACRQVLREELDVEPQPETTALFERLRAVEIPPPSNLCEQPFSDGVFLVSLEHHACDATLRPTVAATALISAISEAVGLRPTTEEPTLEQLLGHLSRRALLLVLDNAENFVHGNPLRERGIGMIAIPTSTAAGESAKLVNDHHRKIASRTRSACSR